MLSEATFAAVQSGTAAPHPEVVPLSVTLLFAAILVGLILCLALEEKLHAQKSVIAGFFAILCLTLGAVMELLPFGEVTLANGHNIKLPVFIPSIDWGVVTIILGASIFVDVTSKSGLFTWIAIKLTKLSKGDPLLLLVFYGAMTTVFSAVLNNVTAMIIIGSLTAVSLDKLGRNDKLLGFLLIEGLLTNVGGLLTLISSVPNIIVGTTAGIGFVDFFVKSSPYVLVVTVITIWLGARRFGIERLASEEKAEAAERVATFDENDGIESMGFFWFGAVMLVLFVAFIAGASFESWAIGKLGMGFVAMSFAMVMLLRYKAEAHTFYSAVDWDLILFFAFLFVTIYVMEEALVLELIGRGFAPHHWDGENARRRPSTPGGCRRQQRDRQHPPVGDARQDPHFRELSNARGLAPLVVGHFRGQPRREPHPDRLGFDPGGGHHHAQARTRGLLPQVRDPRPALRARAHRPRHSLRLAVAVLTRRL